MKKPLYLLFAFFIAVSINTTSFAEITPSSEEFPISTDYLAGGQSTAMAEDGSFVVAWQLSDGTNRYGHSSKIIAKVFNPDGTGKTGIIDVSQESGYNRAASVAIAPDGSSFTVVWQRGSTTYTNIYARQFDADGGGKNGSTEKQVTNFPSGAFSSPSVAMSQDGSFAVLIPSRYSLLYKVYNSNGSVRRGLSGVTSHASWALKRPRLAMSPDGSFWVTWTQWGGLISAKRFDPSGAVFGDKITFSTGMTGMYPYPEAAIAPDGGFVITWIGAKSDNPYISGVYARRYKADGTPIGTEFQVNTNKEKNKHGPYIAIAGDGSYIIIWAEWAGNAPRSVYGQQYSSEGVPYGSPSLIPELLLSFKLAKRIAADGSFLITKVRRWGSDHGIRGQMFRLDCQNPVADAGKNETYEQTSPDGAYVDFDGLASTGTDLSYDWSWDDGTASGAEQTVMLPSGENIVTLMVTNGNCSASDSATVSKTVEDTIDPTTDTVIINGDEGNDEWYRTDVNVTLIASDSGSGVEKVYYQVGKDGEVLSASGNTATVALTTEGEHTIKYWAVDKSTNDEDPRELRIKIDKSAPSITVASPITKEYTVAEELELDFSASDAISGLESITATLNGQAVVNDQTIDLLELYVTNGENHTFTASATDVAGNVTEKVVLFKTIVTADAIIDIIKGYLASGDIKNKGIATSLIKQVSNGGINDFLKHIAAQEGKGISPDAATVLTLLAGSL